MHAHRYVMLRGVNEAVEYIACLSLIGDRGHHASFTAFFVGGDNEAVRRCAGRAGSLVVPVHAG